MKQLSEKAHAILNDPKRIAQRDLWFARLNDLFNGRPNPYNAEHVFTLNGPWSYTLNEKGYTDPEDWIIDTLEILAMESEQPDWFAPLTIFYPIYNVYFITRMFGAEAYFYEDQWYTHQLSTPIGQLQMPDLEKDETWALAKRAAKAFLAADVRLPILGIPSLTSVMVALVNMYGGDVLISMLEEPEAVMHDMVIINDLLRKLHRWYIDTIPAEQLQCTVPFGRTQPPGYGQLCGCTLQLLGPDLYREMVAPLDDALLAEYPNGGMIHLCGSMSQHIPTFREMKHLRSVQLNDRASEDFPLYWEGLRDDQIIYVVPCEKMPLEEILRISNGERIVLIESMPAPKKKLS